MRSIANGLYDFNDHEQLPAAPVVRVSAGPWHRP
jgi:hypothetical protein